MAIQCKMLCQRLYFFIFPATVCCGAIWLSVILALNLGMRRLMTKEIAMDIFRPSARERYNLDSIEPGDVVQITKEDAGEQDASRNFHSLRGHIHSYANRNGKKFATRSVDGALHIKRID